MKKNEMTPEQIKARYEMLKAKEDLKRLNRVKRRVKRFENHFVKPRLLKKGSVRLQNPQLKWIGLKLNGITSGQPFTEEKCLSLVVEVHKWNTPRELVNEFVSMMEQYTNSYHVVGKYDKAGKIDRLVIYPRSLN